MLDATSLIYLVIGALCVVAVLSVVFVVRRRRRQPPAPTIRVEPQAIAFLERVGDDGEPRIHAINKPVLTIGRSEESDIHIPSDAPGAQTVSRRHAQIRREDTEFIIEDLGSQNGIKVNGLATHRNLLRDGYRVTFGNVEFVFRRSGPPGAAGGDV